MKGSSNKNRGDAHDGERVLLYGRRPFQELMRHRPQALQQLFLATGRDGSAELNEAIDEARRRGVAIRELEREQLDSLLDEYDERVEGKRTHQGVAAWVKPQQPLEFGELLKRCSDLSAPLFLAVDQVSDPQNLGSLLRVADAAGVAGCLLTSDRSATLSGTVRRVSAGASELLPISFVKNLGRALSDLKERGFWIVGTALQEESQPIYDIDLRGPIVLVVGSEGKGIRRLTAESCDFLAHIPMQGHVQSLNVSHAAAVALFEALRQRSGTANTPSGSGSKVS